jgi:hypothetical protein
MDEDEVTGWDETGIEIRGSRELRVGDDGFSAEGKSPAEMANIGLYGGPLDGMVVRAASPVANFNQLQVFDTTGKPLTDEIYLARFLDGQWLGVDPELQKGALRSDDVHLKDPRESLSARMGASDKVKWELAIPICANSDHRWSDWRLTPAGNRTRICVICQTTQANIL